MPNLKNLAECAMSQFLVSVESPNRILGVETSQCELMGYNPLQLIGESFGILCGPGSNSSAVGRAIKEASLRSTFTELSGALYDFHGHAQAMHMSFSVAGAWVFPGGYLRVLAGVGGG